MHLEIHEQLGELFLIDETIAILVETMKIKPSLLVSLESVVGCLRGK